MKLTLIDNMPDMMENHWYAGWDHDPPQYRGRYKLNIRITTSQRNFTLQSTLAWPPSELARRQRWRDYRDQYELWRQQSQALKNDCSRDSPIPPLLGMPSELQQVKTLQNRMIHKWYIPPTPSLIRCQLLRMTDRSRYWLIHWLFPDRTLEFVLDAESSRTEVWANKNQGQSLAYIKTYAHQFDLPAEYYMPDRLETFIQESQDLEYELFKQRINQLQALGTDLAWEELRHLLIKHAEYTERLKKETD